jgi:hypothetical protein
MLQLIRQRTAWPARLVLALMVFTAGRSSAQSAQDKALAEALFDEGRKLMDANDYAHACPKLARSQELDDGIGTLLYLADCYEKSGQTASAWATFREAASRAHERGEAERERIATRRAGVLEPLLAKLSIVVEGAADLPGLSVTRDSHRVERELWGLSGPIDPGVHSVDVTAPGKQTWHGSVTVSDSEARIVKIPVLLDLPPRLGAAEGGVPPSGAPLPPRATDLPEAQPNAQRAVAYGLGAVAVVALGVGGGYGLAARSKNTTADEHCSRPGGLCDATGVSSGKDADRLATTSNVAFGVGAALGVGAIVLLLTAPAQRSSSAHWQFNAVASHQGAQFSLLGALP